MSTTDSSPGSEPSALERIQALYDRYVVPSYARFPLCFARGAGSYLYDEGGRRYLDLGSGIATCALGHAHPELAEAVAGQARRLVHTSNLYYHEPQGRLAEAIVRRLGPGKMFFCNSGAEANEGLYKLARKFGHEEGRFEVLTTLGSFHGRTLAGISATGQEKVKKGFEPMVAGFRQAPYNDLEAMRAAISPATAAVLVEGVQGEGGVTPATAEYLLGLRNLCNDQRLLLLVDGVQCGYFRTGRFQSYQRILEEAPGAEGFVPDGVSMAKSLGGGFPIGAFWAREPYAGVLAAGTHASTFGGTPLACTVALKVLEIVERDRLADNARQLGGWLKSELESLAAAFPGLVKGVRGLGFMLGLVLVPGARAFADTDRPAGRLVARLHEAGLLTIPAGADVVRLLPPLNLSRAEAAEGLAILRSVLSELEKV